MELFSSSLFLPDVEVVVDAMATAMTGTGTTKTGIGTTKTALDHPLEVPPSRIPGRLKRNREEKPF